jgi:hypothetical protein
MDTDFTTRANLTCGSWTRGAGQGAPDEDGVGWSCALDDGLFDGGVLPCDANNFVCVTLA